MDSFLFYIPFKGKERPAKTKLFLAKLRAVLVTFGFSKNLIVDSAQCHPAQSPTPRSVGQFWIFEKYSIFFEISSYGSINYLELEIFENLKNLFDSAQC